MKYVKINETRRIGYNITWDYNPEYLLEEAIELSENKIYCKYCEYLYLTQSLTELATELAEDITLKDLLNCGLEDEIIDLLSYSSDIEYFDSEEFEKDREELTSSEILAKDIQGLRDCLENWNAIELWEGVDYIVELIENETINEILKDKKIIVNYWRGYSQGDYEEVYTLIEYKTEEEKAEKEQRAQAEFKYIAHILRGDVYSMYLQKEELIHYKEVNGTGELKQWTELDCDGYGGIVCDYTELEEELTEFLTEALTTEELDKVLSQGLDIEVKY